MSSTNVTNNNIKRNLELIEAFDSLIDYCKDKKIYNKVKDEIEFLCIYHMYIFAITRVLNTNNNYKAKIAIINKFRDYINSNFPNFKQNKYLYLLPKRRKLIYNLINSKFYCIIMGIFKIKN